MRFTWVMFAAAALVAAPAFGQDGFERDVDAFGPDRGDMELLLGGSGTSDEDIKTGDFSIDGELAYYLNENVSVGLRQSLGYDDDGAGTDWNGSTRIAADYHFDLDQWRPFIGANFGYVYGDAVDDTWAAGPEAGVKYYVKPETFLFARAEYRFHFDKGSEIDNKFDDGSFLYGVGIGFNF